MPTQINPNENIVTTAQDSNSNKEEEEKDNNGPISYRPSQSYLDVFWLLSDGKDKVTRSDAAAKLSKLLKNAEETEKPIVLEYCRDRLIRGLSSGRTFARVGFSVALTQLLRDHQSLSNEDVLEAIKKKLNVHGEKRSKSETAGFYLGKAFAFSSLIQSGRITQLSNDETRAIVEELLIYGEKRSYMKPICFTIIEDLVKKISVDTFGDSVWSRIRDPFKEGWQGCTLDKLSLLLACRESFPDVVNKKFLKKHWGFPVLSEDNDKQLLKVILDTENQKRKLLLKRILPYLQQLNRNISSIWKGVGDPLMKADSVKKEESLLQRQIVGLKFAHALISNSSDKAQIKELLLSPSLACAVFTSNTSRKDPLVIEVNALFEVLQQKVKEDGLKVQDLMLMLWSLAEEQSGTRNIITSPNYIRLVDLMDKEESTAFAENLIAVMNEASNSFKLSSNEDARKREIELCLRCLQHIACNQTVTSLELQKSVLMLFTRLAFFQVIKKNGEIKNCNTKLNLEDGQANQKYCKMLFFKILDQLSTMVIGSQKRSNHLNDYMSLLFEVAKYFQSLLKRKNVSPMDSLPEKLKDKWNEIFTVISKIQEISVDSRSSKDKAFLLLLMFLKFQMLNDFETSFELLEEVLICYKKSEQPSKKSDSKKDNEPAWQEVLTEIVLNLMSLQSHHARVVSGDVLSLITSYLTVPAVSLITEVLIPKLGRDDDAGGVMVESKEEESDEDGSLIDEDIADEESDEKSDEDESEDEDESDEDEEMEVDEKFRASVEDALGSAAVKDNGVDQEDEELSDLSDSEMFKLDDMLAEVFRQKEAASGKKKHKKEKKEELYTFRLRVLDLVEVLVKSDRCGDFVLDLLQPLLLVMKSDSKVAIITQSKSILKLLQHKAQGLVDTLHSSEEQKTLVSDLLMLTHNIVDISKLQDVSLACHIAMKVSCDEEKEPGYKCNEVLENSLLQLITTRKTKTHQSFYSKLIGYNVARYQFLCPMLASNLKDPTLKPHGKMICCSVLSNLMKKSQKKAESEDEVKLIQDLANTVSELIISLQANDIKVMFTRELLNLAVALESRDDIFTEFPYGEAVLQKLSEMKPKLNTDLRQLVQKILSAKNKKTANKNVKKGIEKVKAVTPKQKKKRKHQDLNDEVEKSSKKSKQ